MLPELEVVQEQKEQEIYNRWEYKVTKCKIRNR